MAEIAVGQNVQIAPWRGGWRCTRLARFDGEEGPVTGFEVYDGKKCAVVHARGLMVYVPLEFVVCP